MPLILTRNAEGLPTDYHIMSGGLRVGRIYKREFPKTPEMQWLWALNGVWGGPRAIRISGMTATLDQAEAELKESWARWTAWANLEDSTPLDAPSGLQDSTT
jgi:hypothetical protein